MRRLLRATRYGRRCLVACHADERERRWPPSNPIEFRVYRCDHLQIAMHLLALSYFNAYHLPSQSRLALEYYNKRRETHALRPVVASLIMPNMKRSSAGYQIDGRVSIALDALNDKQKQDVTRVIADRDNFIANAANRRRVRKISKDSPVYALSVPSGLRIIFSKVGDDIVVMDLMRQAVLDQFGERQAGKPKGSVTKTSRGASRPKKVS